MGLKAAQKQTLAAMSWENQTKEHEVWNIRSQSFQVK